VQGRPNRLDLGTTTDPIETEPSLIEDGLDHAVKIGRHHRAAGEGRKPKHGADDAGHRPRTQSVL